MKIDSDLLFCFYLLTTRRMEKLLAQLAMYSWTLSWWDNNHVRDEERIYKNKQDILNNKDFIGYLKSHWEENLIMLLKH